MIHILDIFAGETMNSTDRAQPCSCITKLDSVRETNLEFEEIRVYSEEDIHMRTEGTMADFAEETNTSQGIRPELKEDTVPVQVHPEGSEPVQSEPPRSLHPKLILSVRTGGTVPLHLGDAIPVRPIGIVPTQEVTDPVHREKPVQVPSGHIISGHSEETNTVLTKSVLKQNTNLVPCGSSSVVSIRSRKG